MHVTRIIVLLGSGVGVVALFDVLAAHAQKVGVVGAVTLDDVGIDRSITISGGSVVEVVTYDVGLCITKVEIDGELLVDLLINLEVGTHTIVTRIDTDTLVIGVVDGSVDLGLVGTTTDAQVVVPGVGGTHQILHIVVGRYILVVVQVVAVGRTEAIVLCNVTAIAGTIKGQIRPGVIDVLVSALGFDEFGIPLCLIINTILHHGLAFLGTLGGDEDYTVGTTGTIDSGRSRILQDVDALDVVGRDVINRRNLYTIDDEERFVALGDGATTTHADSHRCTWTTVL